MTLIRLSVRQLVPWRVFIIATKLNGEQGCSHSSLCWYGSAFHQVLRYPTSQPVCPMQFRHMLFICLHGAVQRIIILTGMMLRDSYCFPDKTCLSPRHMFLRLRITFAPEPEVAKPLLQENGWTCTNLLMSIRCKGSTMSNTITMSTDFNCDGWRGVKM